MRSIRRYGLIGYPLQHSLSPFIHTRIMEIAGIRGEYRLYELGPKKLEQELPKLLAGLDGFNCTIPHKQAVIPHLRELHPSAALYGAVNTVYRGVGYNTDGEGFRSCRVPLAGRRVCILGAGGVARVLAVEAARAGALEIVIKARTPARSQELIRTVQAQGYAPIRLAAPEDQPAQVYLNGTPVGMWPQVQGVPVEKEGLNQAQVVYDTIYNPTATRLVLQAKSRGLWAMGGLNMLFAQALAAQRIWNPDLDFSPFAQEFAELERELAREVWRRSPIKLVLTGFMGAGKSSVGRKLAELTGLPFVDLDEVIARKAELSIEEIFASKGEDAFRTLERQCLGEELGSSGSLILATGGGTVVQPGAEEAIRSAGGLIVYLDVLLETALRRCAADAQRPLLRGSRREVEELYRRRKPSYERTADLQLAAEASPGEVAAAILTAFGWR